MYLREIASSIEKWMFKNKVLVLYGARQVGKTTLCTSILKKYESSYKCAYYNCEDVFVQNRLIDKSADQLSAFFADAQIIVLDEAQAIPNIGRIIKVFHDAYPDVQIIATGSSSFELSSSINEPLTGRSIDFTIFPLSFAEITKGKNALEKMTILEERMKYGMYPEIASSESSDSVLLLENIANKYLFKDILAIEGIKNTPLIYKLLKALAYQLGSEVSYQELARILGSSQHTIEKYIDILEKAFIIVRLSAFSTNLRKEIKKGQKIFFVDIGIRNALIGNYDEIELRNDKGALFENFCLLEQMKNAANHQISAQWFFWRTYDQQEVDIIKQENGKLIAYECKWNPKKNNISPPIAFAKQYYDIPFILLDKESF